MSHNIIVIPARMQATRLPGKPLADIHGEPMIVHVWRQAVAMVCFPLLPKEMRRQVDVRLQFPENSLL